MLVLDQLLSAEYKPISLPGINLKQCLFFDIETTGLSSRSSHIYLIGAICQKEDQWHLLQYFAEKPTDEESLLLAFSELVQTYSQLVCFNGLTFDLPYLKKKYACYQRKDPFDEVDTLDLYQRLRPLKSLLGLSSIRQKDFEDKIGFQREDTMTGGELIEVYKDFLASGEKSLLELLLLHNHDDMLGMCSILPMCRICCLKQAPADIILPSSVTFSEDQQTHELCIHFSLTEAIPSDIQSEGPCCHLKIYGSEGLLTVRGCYDTKKMFFTNYKDYYYLPLEDTAIHKSVGSFVDPSVREKAKAGNAYQKKTGVFYPQPEPILQPAFYDDAKKRISFFLLAGTGELLFDYLCAMVKSIL